MLLDEENPKDSTTALLDLINEFGKEAGYERNVKKSTARLYTNDEVSERETTETIPSTVTAEDKRNKTNRQTDRNQQTH